MPASLCPFGLSLSKADGRQCPHPQFPFGLSPSKAN
jgi:hypothetical protein